VVNGNVVPTVTLVGPTTVDEGDTASYSYTVSDPDDDTFSLTSESCGAGGTLSNSSFDESTGTGSFDCTFPDGPVSSDVSVEVTDDGSESGTASLTVLVANVAPSVTGISVPSDPVNLDDQSAFVAAVSFSDPAKANDNGYICEFDFDNNGTMDVTDSAVAYDSCQASLTYPGPGVYTVSVTVTDEDGDSGCMTATEFIVIFDPDGGFVMGGGWIRSPAGAYAPEPTLTGNALFGFVSRYQWGASAPTGYTRFRFRVGSLSFLSEKYDWLVVTGSDYAKFKGSGTINGQQAPNGEPYKFMLWAGDNVPDTFRIKIWWEEVETERVVYDNGMDQAIGGGNIVVHTQH
jgi:hypothetical protein